MKLVSDVERLYFRGAAARGPRALLIYPERRGEPTRIGYDELLERARGAAAGLEASGAVCPNEPFLLLAGSDVETVAAFLGGVLLGALPVTFSPPLGLGGLDAWQSRLDHAVRVLGATAVVGPAAFLDLLGDTLPRVDSGDLPRVGPGRPDTPLGASHIQLTSGSTSDAKGVVITHENLEANLYGIGWCSEVVEQDVVVSWLPLYHDMGLVGAVLFSLFWNLDLVLLSPVSFLTRPVSWLQAISAHKGSLSPAPSFAFPYVAHRLRGKTPDVDLSSWRVAYCGAEPIQRAAVQRFVDFLSPCGLSQGTLLPCYGLAEVTLAATFVPAGRGLESRRVSRRALAAGRVLPPEDVDDAEELVLLGTALPEVEIEVRDEQGGVCAEGVVGSVWLRGPSVTPGYFRDDSATTASRDSEGWLDTEDLGCFTEGELALIGRTKDIIIVRGSNHAPATLEWAAEAVEGVRPGTAAAFAIPDSDSGTESAVLVCEVAEDESDWSRGAIARQVEDAVLERVGLRLRDVRLLAPGAIPKTTSGKIRRAHTRELYLTGDLGRTS